MCLIRGQFVWSRNPDGRLVLTVTWSLDDPGIASSAAYGSMGLTEAEYRRAMNPKRKPKGKR